MSKTSEEIDHERTDEPVCPYCGAEQTDSWELRDGETDCGSCCKPILVYRNVTVTWTTRKP